MFGFLVFSGGIKWYIGQKWVDQEAMFPGNLNKQKTNALQINQCLSYSESQTLLNERVNMLNLQAARLSGQLHSRNNDEYQHWPSIEYRCHKHLCTGIKVLHQFVWNQQNYFWSCNNWYKGKVFELIRISTIQSYG